MPTKRKGGAGGASVLDLDTAGVYRPRTKVRPALGTVSTLAARSRRLQLCRRCC
jgi:hypothetical protein